MSRRNTSHQLRALRATITAKGLTQAAVAYGCGMSATGLSAILSGSRPLSEKAAERLEGWLSDQPGGCDWRDAMDAAGISVEWMADKLGMGYFRLLNLYEERRSLGKREERFYRLVKLYKPPA